MKRIKISSVVTIGLLLVGSSEFVVASRGFEPTGKTTSENPNTQVSSAAISSKFPRMLSPVVDRSQFTAKKTDSKIEGGTDNILLNNPLPTVDQAIQSANQQNATTDSINLNQETVPAENQTIVSTDATAQPSAPANEAIPTQEDEAYIQLEQNLGFYNEVTPNQISENIIAMTDAKLSAWVQNLKKFIELTSPDYLTSNEDLINYINLAFGKNASDRISTVLNKTTLAKNQTATQKKSRIKSPAQSINTEQPITIAIEQVINKQINNIMNDSSKSPYEKMNQLAKEKSSAPEGFKFLYDDAHKNANNLKISDDMKSVKITPIPPENKRSTTSSKSPEYNSIQESLASLLSYGLEKATSMRKVTNSLATNVKNTINIIPSTIKSAVINIINKLAPQTPVEITTKIAADISAEPIPTSTNSAAVQAWLTTMTQKIYDAIFGTPEEQLAKTLATKYQNQAQLLIENSDLNTSTIEIEKFIGQIINSVRSNISVLDQTNLIKSILTPPDFIDPFSTISPSNFIKPDPALWQNSNEWSTNLGAFDPTKFNQWMTKTVKLINAKARTTNPTVESSITSSASVPAASAPTQMADTTQVAA